jgi:hypothetical protein
VLRSRDFPSQFGQALAEAGHRVSIVLPRRYIGELASLPLETGYELIPYPANT